MAAFHEGELAVQARVGVRDKLEAIGQRNIRDYMPDQHREFFEELPFLALGAHDGELRPWASLLVGRPGFVRSPDPRTLTIAALPSLPVRVAAGARIGLLGIQLETRRRNRANGTVTEVGSGLVVHVEQSFGNCPQYIQARRHSFADGGPGEPHEFDGALPASAAALIDAAATFFIATAGRAAVSSARVTEGLDVSHRGGRPGFVRREQQGDRTVLTYPEFRGNFYFNTLGNLAQNPRAGLLFVDFRSGDCLSLTGSAEILWDDPRRADFVGAERFVRFIVSAGRWVERAVPLRWSPPELARETVRTGRW